MLFFLVLLIVTIFSIYFCYQVAKKRQADPFFWGVMGAILGPLAIPLVFFSKPENK